METWQIGLESSSNKKERVLTKGVVLTLNFNAKSVAMYTYKISSVTSIYPNFWMYIIQTYNTVLHRQNPSY